jgi:hypothetical protein
MERTRLDNTDDMDEMEYTRMEFLRQARFTMAESALERKNRQGPVHRPTRQRKGRWDSYCCSCEDTKKCGDSGGTCGCCGHIRCIICLQGSQVDRLETKCQ